MPFMLRLYLNTSLASVILFIMLAVWGGAHAIRNRAMTPNYQLALVISQAILAVLCLFYVGLRLGGQVASETLLPLMYHLVALIVLPCIRLYLGEPSPRRAALTTALACVFTVSIVLRALQTSGLSH